MSENLTEEEIAELIRSSPEFAVNCLKELFKRQTPEESRAGKTKEQNQRGFSSYDAEILTSFTKQVFRWESEDKHRFPSPLSEKQMVVLRNRLLRKYTKQLYNILNEVTP